MNYDIQCESCGQFCKPHDEGTYYGGCFDLEPPDPSFFCEKCVNRFLQEPERIIVGCWWLKPNFVRIAKSINRHYKKLKPVEVGRNVLS